MAHSRRPTDYAGMIWVLPHPQHPILSAAEADTAWPLVAQQYVSAGGGRAGAGQARANASR